MAEARLLQPALDASGKGLAMASPGGDTHTSGHWRERMSKESFATSGAYALSHRDPHTMQRLIQTAPSATPYWSKSRANTAWDLYQTGHNPISGYTVRPRAHSKKSQAAPFTSHRLTSVSTQVGLR